MKFAIKNALIYFLISLTWILVSDELVHVFFLDDIIHLQTYKGIFFVTITSILFYFLSYRNILKIQREKSTAEINYHKYKTLFNQLADYVIVSRLEDDGTIKEIIEINESTKDRFGKASYALLDKLIRDKDGKNKIIKDIEVKDVLHKEFSSFDFSYQDKHETRYFEVNSNLLTLNNENIVISICRDITERTKEKKELEEIVIQKDIFLKEIHHRLKNTFQLITSLINLQLRAKNINDATAHQVLREFKSRIISMSLVHKELYSSENISNINFNIYVSKLVGKIKDVFSEKDVEVKIISDDIILGLEQSIPCGLIINELVFNSFKYAFETDKKGQINIIIKEDKNYIIIKVIDNGNGFPIDLDLNRITSVGLRLIKELTEQLEGTIKQYNDNGSCTEIKFEKILRSDLII
jgi:two-component sensor histidine kinase